jgi:hypothetical protein
MNSTEILFDKYLSRYNRFVKDSREHMDVAKKAGDIVTHNTLQKQRRAYHYDLWLASQGLDPKKDKTSELKEQFNAIQKRCIVKGTDGFLYYNRGRETLQAPVVEDVYCIYMWRLSGVFHEDLPVYKIGITRHARGLARVVEVAHELGVKPNLLRIKPVCKAKKLEKKLLCLGKPVGISGFKGYSELRSFDKPTLAKVLKLLDATPEIGRNLI